MNATAATLALLLMTAPTTATAESSSAERITACEEALDSADRVINIQASTISELDAQNHRLERALEASLAEAAHERAWYKDVSIMGPLAFVTGVALGAYVVRGN